MNTSAATSRVTVTDLVAACTLVDLIAEHGLPTIRAAVNACRAGTATACQQQIVVAMLDAKDQR